MIWSVSSGKQYERCPRQWYYKNIVANARVKNDSFRREVTILSKLKSVEAWRGTLVDQVISRRLVYGIKNGYSLKKDYYISEALKEFDQQLQFAKAKKYRVEGFKFSDDDDFAALFAVEFDQELTNEILDRAKDDIVKSISQVLGNSELVKLLGRAKALITQRPLAYKFNKFTVRAVPDLIAFFDDRPVHIIDWKVHTFGTKAYDDQLQSYAIALDRVIQQKPHSDFPTDLSKFSLYEVRLMEFQLLQPKTPVREYEVTEETVIQSERKISSSILSIYQNGGFKSYEELEPEMFNTTQYPDNCLSCPFKKICKQHEYEIRNRHVPDLEPKRTYVQLPLI